MITQMVTGGEDTGLCSKEPWLGGQEEAPLSLGHTGHTPGRSLSGIPLVFQTLNICLVSWFLIRSYHTLV